MLSETQAASQGLPAWDLIPEDMKPFAMFTMDDDDGHPLWEVDWNKEEMAREERQDKADASYIEHTCRQARLGAMAEHYQNQENQKNEVSYFV